MPYVNLSLRSILQPNWLVTVISADQIQVKGSVTKSFFILSPLLPTWFSFNSSMDKKSQAQENTSCEFIMNDCITTTKQCTTKPCAYFLGYTVWDCVRSHFGCRAICQSFTAVHPPAKLASYCDICRPNTSKRISDEIIFYPEPTFTNMV